MTTPAELEPVTAGQLALIGDGTSFSVSALADELAAPLPETSPEETQPFPALPVPVELTGAQATDLRRVSRLFGSVRMTSRRSLAPSELEALAAETDVITSVLDPLTKRLEEIKETLRHHMDVTAEEDGTAVPKAKTGRSGEVIVAATPRDQKGHYLLAKPKSPWKVLVSGFSKGWEQRFSSGSVTLSGAVLDDLLAREQITRAEYLGFTREIRALDEERAHEFIRRNPARGLQVLRAITRRSAPSASLYGPKR